MGFEPDACTCTSWAQLPSELGRHTLGMGHISAGFSFPWNNLTINFNEISLTSLTCIFDDNKNLHVPLVHFSLIVQIK